MNRTLIIKFYGQKGSYISKRRFIRSFTKNSLETLVTQTHYLLPLLLFFYLRQVYINQIKPAQSFYDNFSKIFEQIILLLFIVSV